MVETPLRFLKVDEEFLLPHPAKFRHAKLRKTPEGFDAVDMVFPTGEFILMVVNSMVTIAIGHQSVISLPAIGIDITAFHDSTLKNGHKFSLGAVLHNTHKNSSLPFVQTKDRRFPTGSAPAFAANSFGSKVAFIYLDVPDKRPGFLDRQFHDSVSKKGINALGRFAVQPDQNCSRGCWNIYRETLQNPAELDL